MKKCIILLIFMFSFFFLSCSNNQSKDFLIVYDLNGGISNNLVTSFNEDEIFELPVPTKEGFKFVGWYENDNLVEVINQNKDYHLIAKWELVNVYNINYNLNGGICDDLIMSFKENEFISLPIAKRTDFKFLGWYENDNLIEEINENKDYHLVAKWEKLNLLILYNENILDKVSLHELFIINHNDENIGYNFNAANDIQGDCITNENYTNLNDSFVYEYYFEATFITTDFSNNELNYLDLNYTCNVSLQLQTFGHFNDYLKNNGVIDQDNKINFEIDEDDFLKVIKKDFSINDTITFKQQELKEDNLNVITILFNSTKFKEIFEKALKEKVVLYTNKEESLYNLYKNNLDELLEGYRIFIRFELSNDNISSHYLDLCVNYNSNILEEIYKIAD